MIDDLLPHLREIRRAGVRRGMKHRVDIATDRTGHRDGADDASGNS